MKKFFGTPWETSPETRRDVPAKDTGRNQDLARQNSHDTDSAGKKKSGKRKVQRWPRGPYHPDGTSKDKSFDARFRGDGVKVQVSIRTSFEVKERLAALAFKKRRPMAHILSERICAAEKAGFAFDLAHWAAFETAEHVERNISLAPEIAIALRGLAGEQGVPVGAVASQLVEEAWAELPERNRDIPWEIARRKSQMLKDWAREIDGRAAAERAEDDREAEDEDDE